MESVERSALDGWQEKRGWEEGRKGRREEGRERGGDLLEEQLLEHRHRRHDHGLATRRKRMKSDIRRNKSGGNLGIRSCSWGSGGSSEQSTNDHTCSATRRPVAAMSRVRQAEPFSLLTCPTAPNALADEMNLLKGEKGSVSDIPWARNAISTAPTALGPYLPSRSSYQQRWVPR